MGSDREKDSWQRKPSPVEGTENDNGDDLAWMVV